MSELHMALRQSPATLLAEAGVEEYMLMSIMGWTNPNQARKSTLRKPAVQRWLGKVFKC